MKILYLCIFIFHITDVVSQVNTFSFTCCQKIEVPEDVIIDEDSQEFIVTPEDGIEFETTDENTNFIRIYGRWGNLVFEQANPGDNFSWDGRSNNGRLLAEGTYYYFIIQKNSANVTDEVQNGFITILN